MKQKIDEKANFNKGLVVIIGGTSGAGKDTIIKKVIEKNPSLFGLFVSYATRAPRDSEVNGIHYHFITEKEFLKHLRDGEIVEFTTRHNEYKGMSARLIDAELSKGLIAIKDAEVEGVKGLRKYGYNLLSIYLTVPREEVARRLCARGCSDEELAHRLSDYDNHLSSSKFYDVLVENKEIEVCAENIYQMILSRINKG